MLPRMLFPSVLLLPSTAFAQKIPIREVAQHSAEITNLTVQSSAPFHLKASVSSGADPTRQGVIEEYWLSPTQWRRTIETDGFSQTTIVNGKTHYEKNVGDYFPSALRVISESLLQPIPDSLQQALSQSKVKLKFNPGLSAKAEYCDANLSRTGTPPAENSVLLSVCFSGDPASISSIAMPGYHVEFKDRQPFGKLLVARHLTSGSMPETNGSAVTTGPTVTVWEARITDLSAISEPDESLFFAPKNTPEARRFKLFQTDEQEARQQFKNLPKLDWPAVHEGETSGVITIYVSLDKTGRAREAWPLRSDNPEISVAACEQMMDWRFGEGHETGRFVQLETLFTFFFQTQRTVSQPGKLPAQP